MSAGSDGLSAKAKTLLEGALDAKQLAERIRDEIAKGREFVPLLGSGISLPAGIPTIKELSGYLQRCITMALGLDGAPVRPWNPRTDQWPSMQHPEDKFDRSPLAAAIEHLIKGSQDPKKRRIYLEAASALDDWRSALQFLARIEEPQATGQDYVPVLGPMVRSIKDSFFQHVTADRIPTLAHSLLASLSDELRNHIVLTTNFDDLYKEAAEQSYRPVAVYDVHIDARLPLRRLVDRRRSLIKLHGGQYGLRADQSLDETPSEEDLHTFTSYFTRGEAPRSTQVPCEAKRHLLVMGYGASDNRINKLISEALARVELEVFWIGYSSADVARLAEVFKLKELQRFRIVVHKMTGLLLAELHQRLTFALPSARVRFPTASEVSFPPMYRNRYGMALKRSVDGSFQHGTDCEERLWILLSRPLYDRALQFLNKSLGNRCRGRLVVMTNARDENRQIAPYFGVSVVGSLLFDHFCDQYANCVWIDMDEIVDADDLFEQVVDAMAAKIGLYEWRPTVIHRPQHRDQDGPQQEGKEVRRSRQSELHRILERSRERWIVFLYARDGAGSNVKQCWDPSDKCAKRWLAEDDGRPLFDWVNKKKRTPPPVLIEKQDDYKPDSVEDLIELLTACRTAPGGELDIVLMCLHGELIDELNKPGMIDAENVTVLGPNVLDSSDGQLQKFDVTGTVDKWLGEDETERPARIRFLYGLALFRQTRFPVAVWLWALHLEGPPNAMKFSSWCSQVDAWLDKLAQLGIVRRKVGGFIWMHRWIREAVIRWFVEKSPPTKRTKDLTRPETHVMKIHHGLAEWYWRLFLTSKSSQALCESVFHRCWNAEAALRAICDLMRDGVTLKAPARPLNGANDAQAAATELDPQIDKYIQRAVGSIRQAGQALIRGKRRLVSTERAQATCRMLQNIRENMVTPLIELRYANKDLKKTLTDRGMYEACRGLQRICLQCEFEITLEVSEHKSAFMAMLQLGELILNQKVPHWQIPTQLYLESASNPDAKDWLRDFGALYECTRSYDKAKTIYDTATGRLGAGMSDAPLGEDGKCEKWILERLRAREREGECRSPEEIRTLTSTLIKRMELELLRGDAEYLRLSRTRKKGKKEFNDDQIDERRIESLKRADRIYRMAVEALRCIEDDGDQFSVAREAWKLFAQMGLLEGRRHHFEDAKRRLADAASCVWDIEPRERDFAVGVLDIYRANVLYIQAQNTGNFAPLRRSLYRAMEQNEREKISKMIAYSILRLNGETIASIESLLDDANEALERARTRLAGSRSVMWITRYYYFRLKVFELQLALSIFVDKPAIPGFGLEAAPRGSQIEPIRLLDELGRMVRRDVFIWARGLESFVRSVQLFQLRAVDLNAPHIAPGRLDECAHTIHDHVERLNERFAERKKMNPAIDRDVVSYVRHVVRIAKSRGLPAHGRIEFS